MVKLLDTGFPYIKKINIIIVVNLFGGQIASVLNKDNSKNNNYK